MCGENQSEIVDKYLELAKERLTHLQAANRIAKEMEDLKSSHPKIFDIKPEDVPTDYLVKFSMTQDNQVDAKMFRTIVDWPESAQSS